MAIDLRRPSTPDRQLRGQRQARNVARIALLGAIVLFAMFQGYSSRSWILLGGLVAWAAALPWLLRGISRQLGARQELSPRLRQVILILAALALLGGFAAVARLVLSSAF